MSTLLGYIVVGLGALVLVGVLSVIAAFPTMWLWNYVVPDVFSLPTITLGQAIALNCLSGILIKSTSTSSKYKDNLTTPLN